MRPPASSQTRPRGRLLFGVHCPPSPPWRICRFCGVLVFPSSLSAAQRRGEWPVPSAVPARGHAWDSGPGGTALRRPSSLSHTAQRPRTAGGAVEFGFAESWALGPMLVHPCRPSPWPPGAWRSAYSRRPPAPCACSTSPSP